MSWPINVLLFCLWPFVGRRGQDFSKHRFSPKNLWPRRATNFHEKINSILGGHEKINSILGGKISSRLVLTLKKLMSMQTNM